MHNETAHVNEAAAPIIQLRNVLLFSELVDRVMRRSPGLPGLATFHGPSGYGKSFSAVYSANVYRAYYVQMKSVWTRKRLCEAVLQEMGIQPRGTIPTMLDAIGEQLALSQRPLLIDEADFLVKRGQIELVRDIYESSTASAIILIGEESLPGNLKQWERVHGRVLDWVQAQPAGLEDAMQLAGHYCKGVVVAEDLLKRLVASAKGSVRRIAVNLDRVREFATINNLREIDAAGYEGEIFTGEPPTRRG